MMSPEVCTAFPLAFPVAHRGSGGTFDISFRIQNPILPPLPGRATFEPGTRPEASESDLPEGGA